MGLKTAHTIQGSRVEFWSMHESVNWRCCISEEGYL